MGKCYLYDLPNELLLYLFAPISTPDLLPLTVLSNRIHNIILRILHNRLVQTAELDAHTLLLECFHPSVQLTEPHYFCTYLGTQGLSLYQSSQLNDKIVGRLAELDNLYCRFRPHRGEPEARSRRRLPRPGDIPGSRTFPGGAQDQHEGPTVRQMLYLEEHELFTQLVARINLVKIGPRKGLFTCFISIQEGVLRVWKEWLRDIDRKGRKSQADEELEIRQGTESTQEIPKEIFGQNPNLDDPRILWVTPSKNTGIRFNVRERRLQRAAPILVRADEDSPVSYEIEYDELLIRTSHLLFMLEKSVREEDTSSGKAVVFGSFV